MSWTYTTMTRRKQNAPKRLNSCDNQPGSERAQDQAVDSQPVDSQSGSEEEEEEEEGAAEKGEVNETDVESEADEDVAAPPETSDRTGYMVLYNEKQDTVSPIAGSESDKKVTGVAAEIIPKQNLNDDEVTRTTNTISEYGHSSQSDASGETSRCKPPSTIVKDKVHVEETVLGRYTRSRLTSYQSTSADPESSSCFISRWAGTDTQSVPSSRKSHASTSCAGNQSEVTSHKYKYSSKLSPPGVSQSPGILTNFDRQMALVMSSMPLVLLAKGRKDIDTRSSYFSSIDGMSSPTEDQPLDLSKKTDKEKESDVSEEQYLLRADPLHSKPPRSLSPLSTLPSSSIVTNGFSSLQSLQQRFGGEFPVRAAQTSGSSVIPLQPSVTPKPSSAASLTADHAALRSPVAHRFKQCGSTRGIDWLEQQEKRPLERSSSSPPSKQDRKSRPRTVSPLGSPGEDLNQGGEGSSNAGESEGSKHTIHRCSCHKTFGSLYGLSVHLQETGHAPGASRSTSLMDYPKLVRGQDMWLNQESEQTRRILRCMQCGESFKSLPLLTVHMMQTQHYTKIVSSEHGRRSHKCSTYCDRELDKECIFKCKVCHETFTDMEGLANHMIVSGHHKKQSSSRHVTVTPSQASLTDVSALARHGGKRKRFLRDDVASVAAAADMAAAVSSSAASFLESSSTVFDCSGRHGKLAGFSTSVLSDEALSNGFHIDSFSSAISPRKSLPSITPINKVTKSILCDSCGKRFDAPIFDAHVRACLRQRAEVIDALKSKLAVEEALLSRSESKLLRSGFTLSSSSSSTDAVGSLQEQSPLVKSEVDSVHEPENFLREGSAGIGRMHSVDAEEENISSMQKNLTCAPKPSTESDVATSRSNISDLTEVPLKKWYCSKRDGSSPIGSTRSSTVFDSRELSSCASHENHHIPDDSGWKSSRDGPKDELETESQDDVSLHPGQKKNKGGEGSPCSTNSNDSIAVKSIGPDEDDGPNSRESSTRSRPHTGADTAATDFTSSALHKLDMFSRGLKLSPPRRATLSPESSKQHHSNSGSKTAKRRELSGSNRTPISRRDSIASKSPSAAPISPVSLAKSENSPEPQRDATFDILDPNMGSGHITSSSAIEAMESFIHKSFSAKSDIRTSSLATMFSPFRTCFPLPGSMPSHVTADPADPALSCFAKFSKFFRMVPGAPPLPDMASPRYSDQKLNSMSLGLSSPGVRTKTSLNVENYDSIKQLGLNQGNPNLSSSHKSPASKPFHPKLSKGFSVKNSSKSSDSITSAKRYKYSSLNPEDVAKHMTLGSHNPTNRCGAVHTPTPLAAYSNTCVRKSSKDSPPATSALPSTSELEKMKSELKRKRKMSSTSADSAATKSKESSHGDEGVCSMLRPNSRGIIGRRNKNSASECTQEESMSGNDPSESPNKESVSSRLHSNPRPVTAADDMKIQTNKMSKDDPCVDGDTYSPRDTSEEINSCEKKGNFSSVESGQEVSQVHAMAGDEKTTSCTQPKPSDQDIHMEVNGGDSDSHTSCVSPSIKTYTSEPDNRNQKSKRHLDDDEVDVCSKTMKTDNESGSETQQITKPSPATTDCTETELYSEASHCNVVEHKPGLASRQSRSCSIEDSDRVSPLHTYEDNSKEGQSKRDRSVPEMAAAEISRRSVLKKDNIVCEQNEDEFALGSSSKSVHSPSPWRSPSQSLDDVGNINTSEDIIKQLETNKDQFQSGRVSASSSPSSLSSTTTTTTVERKFKKHSDVEESSSQTKSSALDSLSCFVYSQPLTSEHPLDSLQKLLSTNDLPSGPQGHSKSFDSSSFAPKSSPTSSYPTHQVNHTAPSSSSRPTGDSSPLNLTLSTEPGSSRSECETKPRAVRPRGTDVTSDSEEDEEYHTASVGPAEDIEETVESGCTSDGDATVYKCAACNRQFASKGSYRYHLSRCHLSSVKKLGIKDAFNMSPYVYLPLDHTAKFSKYYQMAHELANKGLLNQLVRQGT